MKFLIPLIVLVIVAAGCRKSTEVQPQFSTESRSDFGFRGINAGNAISLIVVVGEEFSITVEGQTDLLKEVKTGVNDEILVIKTTDKISPANKLRLKISMPELRSLELWGSSNATVSNVSGYSLKLQSGGSSSIVIDGRSEAIEVNATGSGKIDGENLRCRNAVVKASGASTVTLAVSEELVAESLGASNVLYVGNPKTIKRNIVGAGEIREK